MPIQNTNTRTDNLSFPHPDPKVGFAIEQAMDAELKELGDGTHLQPSIEAARRVFQPSGDGSKLLALREVQGKPLDSADSQAVQDRWNALGIDAPERPIAPKVQHIAQTAMTMLRLSGDMRY